MPPQTIQTHTFENGLTLVAEPMEGVQSAAFSLRLPAGSLYDPPGQNGTASLLCELLMRGAGPRDTRQLSAALDNLGVQRHENVGTSHLALGGATTAENLAEALRIYGDIVRRPLLPEDQFEAARAGVEQSLRAIEDEPRQKVMVELRRRCYDSPWGLPPDGDLKDLPHIDLETVRRHFDRCFRPDETILGVAGRIDVEEIVRVLDEVFGDWNRQPAPAFEKGPRGPRQDHIRHESAQTHIGIAYDSVPYRDPDYYASWGAVSVLSGGMSSRLFTEIREKRGLCYAVFASLNSLKDAGRVMCYAGTTNERAQETLDVTLQELMRLRDGIAEDELDRCKARAKSSLIMQQESTSARSSSIARDWYHLGRVRTLDEVHENIDALSTRTVLDYVHRHPPGDFTLLTIGPEPLELRV